MHYILEYAAAAALTALAIWFATSPRPKDIGPVEHTLTVALFSVMWPLTWLIIVSASLYVTLACLIRWITAGDPRLNKQD